MRFTSIQQLVMFLRILEEVGYTSSFILEENKLLELFKDKEYISTYIMYIRLHTDKVILRFVKKNGNIRDIELKYTGRKI